MPSGLMSAIFPSGSHPVARPQKHRLERLHCLPVAPNPQAQDGLHEVREAGAPMQDSPPCMQAMPRKCCRGPLESSALDHLFK